jgi:hypothetical protein
VALVLCISVLLAAVLRGDDSESGNPDDLDAFKSGLSSSRFAP